MVVVRIVTDSSGTHFPYHDTVMFFVPFFHLTVVVTILLTVQITEAEDRCLVQSHTAGK